MSEFSYGERLSRGRTLKTALASFPTYVPLSGEKSASGIGDTIQSLELLNPPLNDALYDYRESVFARRNIYVVKPDSITLVLSPILSYVSGQFGKNSIQYRVIKSQVGKLRGQRLGPVNPDPTAATHSVSQMSFASMYENYNTMVTTIIAFGVDYDPANPSITTANLEAIRDAALAANDLVDQTYDTLSPLQEARNLAYEQFSVQCQCVKNLVKSQYGVRSNQYKLVKGLSI